MTVSIAGKTQGVAVADGDQSERVFRARVEILKLVGERTRTGRTA
jgi:hypothetical protein